MTQTPLADRAKVWEMQVHMLALRMVRGPLAATGKAMIALLSRDHDVGKDELRLVLVRSHHCVPCHNGSRQIRLRIPLR